MKDRRRFVAVRVNMMVFAWLLASCGSYDDGGKNGTGGASGSTATGGVSGTATGGTGGAGTSGSSGTGGQAGSGGSGAPTGGAGGAGAGAGGSGGGGPIDCTDVAPCGGDVIGTWTAASCELTVSGMADIALAGLGCTMAPATGSLSVSGTWTASADGMYMDQACIATSCYDPRHGHVLGPGRYWFEGFGLLSLGIRDGGGGGRPRRQPVRPAGRRREQDRHAPADG